MKKTISINGLLLLAFLFLQCSKTQKPGPDRNSDSTVTTFTHPGILNTKATLDYIRGQANDQTTDRFIWYSQLANYVDASPMPTSYPSVVYVAKSASTPTEAEFKADALLAYALALRWAKSLDQTYADKAIQILNGCATNFVKYTPIAGTFNVQSYLEASWVTPTFVAAAEILKSYKVCTQGANWDSAGQARFKKFILTLHNSYVNKVIGGGHQPNWNLSAGYAKMAVGVYLDDSTIYSKGKAIIIDSLPTAILADGTMPELCGRQDCVHFQYSLTALAYAGEIDRIQNGNEIFKNGCNRILAGFGFMAHVFKNEISCQACSGKSVYPGTEIANRYYRDSATNYDRALKAPYKQVDDLFLGFTTYSHHSVPL